MKMLSKMSLALLSAFLVVPAFAGTDAGENSARHYRNNPEQYDGKKVDVDVAFVSRINRKDCVEGVKFFVAHTVDDDNHAPGGSIIVAVLDDEADSFMRKYGTAIDRSGRKVDAKRLRGTFHKLKCGRVYIDESGEAHALIEAHIEKHGVDAIPEDEPEEREGRHPKKRF